MHVSAHSHLPLLLALVVPHIAAAEPRKRFARKHGVVISSAGADFITEVDDRDDTLSDFTTDIEANANGSESQEGLHGHREVSILPDSTVSIDDAFSNSYPEMLLPELFDWHAASLTEVHGVNLEQLTCHSSVEAPEDNELCPTSCPFYAEDPRKACYFKCVEKGECGSDLTRQSSSAYDVPDKELQICRKCIVRGCRQCSENGLDECRDCHWGYFSSAGTCLNSYTMSWNLALVVMGIVMIILGAWLIDMMLRPPINEEVMEAVLEHREQLKLRDESTESREAFPVSYDVHNAPAYGGRGFNLHMDYQRFMIIWSVAVTIAWLIFLVLFPDAVGLGTLKHEDARHACLATVQGRKTRDQIVAGKTALVVFMYIFTTCFVLLMAVVQRRKFNQLSSDSLQNYALLCSGFPTEQGKDVEADYADFLKLALGEEIATKLVGLSVCWDQESKKAEVEKLIDEESELHELDNGTANIAAPAPQEPSRFFERFEAQIGVNYLLGITDADSSETEQQRFTEEREAEEKTENPQELLLEVPSSGFCYVVFQTEFARDAASEVLKTELAARYKGEHRITARAAHCEPAGVLWKNFSSCLPSIASRVLCGVGFIIMTLVLWCVVIYVPYAYFMYVDMSSGLPPDLMTQGILATFVVLGSHLTYLVCGMVAEGMRLQTKDWQESVYVMGYTAATFLNLILDVGVVAYTAYLGMCSHGVRTAEGKLLSELDTLDAIMLSYPLQKFLGEQMYIYNVMGCLIVPYFFEPVLSIGVPYFLSKVVVRTHTVSFRTAVKIMSPTPMDLTRYADLVMNSTLVCITLMLSTGWVLASLIALVVGNIWIYCWDRVRTARSMLAFCYSSSVVDDCVQRCMALPCAVLAVAVVFQLREMDALPLVAVGSAMPTCLILAFSGHLMLHQMLLELVYMCVGPKQDVADQTWEQASRREPCDWFTTNKVHCLRSKYLHQPASPVEFIAVGEIPIARRRSALAHQIAGPSSSS